LKKELCPIFVKLLQIQSIEEVSSGVQPKLCGKPSPKFRGWFYLWAWKVGLATLLKLKATGHCIVHNLGCLNQIIYMCIHLIMILKWNHFWTPPPQKKSLRGKRSRAWWYGSVIAFCNDGLALEDNDKVGLPPKRKNELKWWKPPVI
jgi:hypothetical protein